MSQYPYLQSKIDFGYKRGSRGPIQAYQTGSQGFSMFPNTHQTYQDDENHNYPYYEHLEQNMKTKSENRLNNNLRLLTKYKNRKKTQSLTLQCRNSYELKMIHEEAEKLELKHETIKMENVYQNKLIRIQCTICDHDCGCTKSTRANEKKKPIYGVKIEKINMP